MLLEILGDRQRVVDMALHAQRQRLQADDVQEAVEWRLTAAEIAQADDARADDEGQPARPHRRGPRRDRPVPGSTMPWWRPLAFQSNLPLSTITPPMLRPCPPIHLVVECKLMLTPHLNGLRTGTACRRCCRPPPGCRALCASARSPRNPGFPAWGCRWFRGRSGGSCSLMFGARSPLTSAFWTK